MAVLTISFHDDTHEEIELTTENGLYWKPTMQGLVIKMNGVRGSRTVYPWASIRKYHIETEVGLRDREERAEERRQQQRDKLWRERYVARHGSGAVGGRCHVQEPADQGGGGSEGDAAGRPG